MKKSDRDILNINLNVNFENLFEIRINIHILKCL